MNDTDYGLTAGVYTNDRERAEKILAQVNERLGVLELLRPREPAPAVVGRAAIPASGLRCRPTASRPSRDPRRGT